MISHCIHVYSAHHFFMLTLISCNYDYGQQYIANNYIYEDTARYEKYISYKAQS